MRYPHHWLRLILFAAAIIALVLLAASLGNLAFSPGKPFPFAIFTQPQSLTPALYATSETENEGLLRLATLFIWIGLPLALIYLLGTPEGRRRLIQMLPVFILLLFVLNWLGSQPLEPEAAEGESMSLGMGPLGDLGEGLPPTPDYVAEPSTWLVLGVQVLIALLFLGGLLLVWRWYHKNKESPQDMIVQQAEQALADLKAGEDVRNIILRCYTQMSEVLQKEQDISRHQGMTVREFEKQLAEIGLHSTHIQRLTRLFERVRYSSHSISWQEEQEAMACLDAIVQRHGASA